jgi:rhodanese-related sulfurtransferase
MAAKRTSTIGYERLYNQALQMGDRETFIDSLTKNMPAAPDHFSRCSAINGAGPTLLRDLPPLEAMSPATFKEQAERENTLVLDVRSSGNFGGMHVPGSWSIDFQTNFATFAGWVLPPGKELLLVTENPPQAQEAAVQLRRVGFDRIPGYLHGGMHGWAAAGLSVDQVPALSADTFYEMSIGKQPVVLVDVRTVEEYNKNHIAGAINIPTPDLRVRYQELNLHTPTVVICGSGRRSSLGASILKMQGFGEVFSLAGGMMGYIAAGYPLECPVCE